MKQLLILCYVFIGIYSYGQKSGIAIMADKMNVMYIGVENPITIGIPYDWKNTKVSIKNGTISGTGSKRTVRPDAKPGYTVTLTVTSGIQSSDFNFRIKRIPDPVFKIGSGKMRMSTPEFKAQQYCRADLENFDFDLRYVVKSAKIIFHFIDTLKHETIKTGQICDGKILRKSDLENQNNFNNYNFYDSEGNYLNDTDKKIQIQSDLKKIDENPELDLSEEFSMLKPGDYVEFTNIIVKSTYENERPIDSKTIYLY